MIEEIKANKVKLEAQQPTALVPKNIDRLENRAWISMRSEGPSIQIEISQFKVLKI